MTINVTKIKDETVRQAVYEIDSGGVALSSPNIGAATATSINKVAITAPATSATLTIANGKTLTASKTITLTSADDTSVATLPTGATSLAPLTSPSFTTPTLGVATATSVNKVAITAPATSATLTIADGKTLTASKTITFTSADDTSVVTVPTGTTSLAPLVSPSFTTPSLGAATATSVTATYLTATGYVDQSVGNALTATGTTVGDALQLTKQINNVTTAGAGTGVILPTVANAGVGAAVIIFNAGANAIQVYGAGSDTIDGVAAATGVPLTNAKRCVYIAVAAATWISAQLGVVSA